MRKTEEILNEILNKRGITDGEDREEYLSEKPKRTYDPFLLDGMKAGVDLLISAAEQGDRICIYGDYDADGVTASTVMACGVSRLTDDWFFYIPSRFEEGYGLNVTAIDKIIERGADLIITVDCGCVSCGEVKYALDKGLKVIVTDHHNIEDSIAEGIVIDPKKPASFMSEDGKEPYPCRDLAGCGVAFKFLQALQRTADLPKSVLNEALDMVAVGTIGDIVPLRDENRTLVKYGIAAANSSGRRCIMSHVPNPPMETPVTYTLERSTGSSAIVLSTRASSNAIVSEGVSFMRWLMMFQGVSTQNFPFGTCPAMKYPSIPLARIYAMTGVAPHFSCDTLLVPRSPAPCRSTTRG